MNHPPASIEPPAPATEAEGAAVAYLHTLFPGYSVDCLLQIFRVLRAQYVAGRLPFDDEVMDVYRAAELRVLTRRAVQQYRATRPAPVTVPVRRAREDALLAVAHYLLSRHPEQTIAQSLEEAVGAITVWNQARRGLTDGAVRREEW